MTDLAKRTWHEARDLFDDRIVAILPLGSTEPHGPHLPLDTDVTIAVAQSPRGVPSSGWQKPMALWRTWRWKGKHLRSPNWEETTVRWLHFVSLRNIPAETPRFRVPYCP